MKISSTYDRLEVSTAEIDVAEISWWDAYAEERFCWLHTANITSAIAQIVK